MIRRYIKDKLYEEFNKDLEEDIVDILVDIIIELLKDRYLYQLSLEYKD